MVIELGSDPIYALLADECTDISGKQMMTVVIRYVSSTSGKISERTIGTVRVNNTCSEDLFNTVTTVLARVNLRLSQARGQAYDGASNMSGHLTGLASRVKEESPLAMNIHCCNHRLNLVVQKIGAEVIEYKLVLGVMQLVYNMISASNKRLNWFHEHQKEHRPKKSQLTIKKVSDTRWIYHYNCAKAIKECFASIVYTLDKVIHDDNSTTEHKASSMGILRQIQDWKFIFWLSLLIEILVKINCLNELLQTKKETLWEAMEEVNTCRTEITELNSKQGFNIVWNKATDFARKHDITPPNLSHQVERVVGKTKRKRKVKEYKDYIAHAPTGVSYSQVDNCTVNKSYWRKFSQLMEDMIGEFNTRFNKDCVKIVHATKCLHPYNKFQSFDVEDLKTLYNHYRSDFSVDTDEDLIISEHVHYQECLKREFTNKELKEMTFAKLNIWIHKKKPLALPSC